MKQLLEKNKKILIALGLLFLAAAGLTYAYYNSMKDFKNEFQVKEPGVAINEKFNPTDWWVPGEEKSKQIWFTNTGEMDMLLRFKLKIEWHKNQEEKYIDEEGKPTIPKDKDGKAISEEDLAKIDLSELVTFYWKDSKNGAVVLAEASKDPGFDFVPIDQNGETYYYYKKILKAKGNSNENVTQHVLESVKFDTERSNDNHEGWDYSGVQLDLTIEGETLLVDGRAAEEEWGVKIVEANEAGVITPVDGKISWKK